MFTKDVSKICNFEATKVFSNKAYLAIKFETTRETSLTENTWGRGQIYVNIFYRMS